MTKMNWKDIEEEIDCKIGDIAYSIFEIEGTDFQILPIFYNKYVLEDLDTGYAEIFKDLHSLSLYLENHCLTHGMKNQEAFHIRKALIQEFKG